MLTLDILGISLALLDFTGTARKAEERLRKTADKQRKRAKFYWRHGFYMWKWKYLKNDVQSFLTIVPSGVLLSLFIVWALGRWDNLVWYQVYLPDISWLAWWAWIFLAPAFLALAYIAHRIFSTVAMTAGFVLFYRLFWLLSRPKAGIIGTLGLLLPITTATLNTLSLA